MKVYELIQKLSQFNADTEVKFHVEAEFDENVDFADIDDNERGIYHPNVTINLEY